MHESGKGRRTLSGGGVVGGPNPGSIGVCYLPVDPVHVRTHHVLVLQRDNVRIGCTQSNQLLSCSVLPEYPPLTLFAVDKTPIRPRGAASASEAIATAKMAEVNPIISNERNRLADGNP